MAQTDLAWTATVDRTWIAVNPTAGTGSNNNITITVTSADYGETDLTGTVTFNCTDCSPQQQKVVRVTRCAPTECEYESAGTTSYTFTAVTVSACHSGSVEFDVDYSISYEPITSGCKEPKIVTGSEHIVIPNVGDNEDAEEKIIEEVEGKYKVTQSAGPCHSPCNCESLTVSSENVDWTWDDINEKTVTITIGDECISLNDSGVTLTSGSEYFSLNYGNKIITVNPNSTYSGTGDPRTGTVTIKYSRNDGSGSCPDKTITLKQTSQGDPCAAIDINISSDKQLTCDGGIVKFTATETPKA